VCAEGDGLAGCREFATSQEAGGGTVVRGRLVDLAGRRADCEPFHTPGRYRLPVWEVRPGGPRDADEVALVRLETELHDRRASRLADEEKPLPVGSRDRLIEVGVGVGPVEDTIRDVVDAQVEPGVPSAGTEAAPRALDRLGGPFPVGVEPLRM